MQDVNDFEIVIPLYNKEEQVEELLALIARWNENRYVKVHIIDDCSTDSSYKRVEE
ncbi:glycosyltransferase, partial [Shewanella sp. 4t3-1-2LB]|nr:glycosyltransferase [Shewanella sp. 4t3-1-2LB]